MLATRWACGLFIACASCYSPDLRDCTVTCAATSECTGGQICGDDHFCAAPAHAGTCTPPAAPDAGVDAGGHRPPRHDAAIDAAPDAEDDLVRLTIHIAGQGVIALENGGSCSNEDPTAPAECAFLAPRGLPATLHAIARGNEVFDHWTTATCLLQGATCVFVPLYDTDIGARFRKADL
jgi:hypothetical protein